MNHGWIYRDTVRQQDAGCTPPAFYARRYPHTDRVGWLEHLRNGEIRLNGAPCPEDARLRPGDRLAWHRPPWEEPEVPLHFSIVYRDADVLVVDKPAGLPVLPGAGFLEHTLLHLVRTAFAGGAFAPAPVHRLGRGTSGLMVFALHPEAAAHLCAQFHHPDADAAVPRPCHAPATAEKRYRAVTAGVPPDIVPGQTLDVRTRIGPVPHPMLGRIHAASPAGKPAHSVCTLLRASPDGAVWDIALHTGRPHQIRIHLASIGAPLLGDPLYLPGGGARPDAIPGALGYTLRAYALRFHPPGRARPLFIEIPAPH